MTHRGRLAWALCAALGGTILMMGSLARGGVESGAGADAGKMTDEQIVGSMRKGIDFLFREERKDGTWGLADWEVGGVASNYSPNGVTALVIDALLACRGVDERARFDSKEMGPLVKWLTEHEEKTTYVAGLQAAGLAQLPERAEYHKALLRVKETLVQGMCDREGGYTYFLNGGARFGGTLGKEAAGAADNSNSQYGLLGVWAAAEGGAEVPAGYWKTTDSFWRKRQGADGGWGYPGGERGAGGSTESMTTAGIVSLYVAASEWDTEVRAEPKKDAAMMMGAQRLISGFKGNETDLYYLYGIARMGMASGHKFLGKTNWYGAVTANILSLQQADGSWRVKIGNGTQSPYISTAYALLILAQGRNPLVMNKLEYETGGWNARPNDFINLTKWMSKKYEQPLNWQSVPLAESEAEDWMDAPVLLIAGHADPKFGNEDLLKLRRFVEMGGMVFSVAEGGSPVFGEAMKKYAALVAGDRYEMRELSAEHDIYRIQYAVKNPPRMMGLSNGVRELWVHSPVDMGAAWQGRQYASKPMWEIPGNLFFYQTGKLGLRYKLQSLAVRASEAGATRTMTLGRVAYAGNYDPEPAAWGRMAKIMEGRYGTKVTVVETRLDRLSAERTPVAHITGTAGFVWSVKEREKVAAFGEAGGMLIGDAAGGSETFLRSFLEAMKGVYPEGVLEEIPVGHALYDGSIAGSVKITEVEYRKSWALQNGGGRQPKVVGVKVKGRYVALVSEADVTSGLLGTNTWGIRGYTPEWAEKVGANMVLFARENSVKAAGR